MLKLGFKESDTTDVYSALKRFVQETFGPHVCSKLDGVLMNLQKYRNEILSASMYRGDNVYLEKVVRSAKAYLSIWASASRSFTFGIGPGCVNLTFAWRDSYTRENRVTTSPLAERLAILYNLAVAYSQIGNNTLALPENMFKEAANNYFTAAEIFEKIKIEQAGMRPGDCGVDFTEQNINMCKLIMKAQAQKCCFDKLNHTNPDKFKLLSQLAMQAAIYYGNAYSLSSIPPISLRADARSFIGLLQYHEHVFMSLAYFNAALESERDSKENPSSMGMAVANITKAVYYLAIIGKVESSFYPGVLTSFREIKVFAELKMEYLEMQNKKIFFEMVPAVPDEIEPMIYTKPAFIDSELSQPFEGKADLAQLVPPPVKALEEEFRSEVNTIMSVAFQLCSEADASEKDCFKKHNLPSCLHAASFEQALPEDLWEKIKKCKENGGAAALSAMIQEVAKQSEKNHATLEGLLKLVALEESNDNSLRSKHGASWTIIPSKALNTTMKKQIEVIMKKYAEGKEADLKMREMFESKKDPIAMLDLDKAEITAKIPPCKGESLMLVTTLGELTLLVKQMEGSKKACEEAAERMAKNGESDSVMNDMFQIHQGVKTKTIVFAELKAKYVEMHKHIEALVKERHGLLASLEKAMGQFHPDASAGSEKSERAIFFKTMDHACNTYGTCCANSQQGIRFHAQLATMIEKLKSDIETYLENRAVEREKLVSTLGVEQAYPPGFDLVESDYSSDSEDTEKKEDVPK